MLTEIEKILSKLSAKKVFLVTGGRSFESSGASWLIGEIGHRFDFYRFRRLEKYPEIAELKNGIERYREFGPDTVLAIGGGGVLDTAKLINILAHQPAEPEAYIAKKKPLQKRGKPLIAIPTTAGSGSEATRFAVIYIDKKKYSLSHDFILPDFSILHPPLTHSLPAYVTASTGMDALSQAIESYWNVHSTDRSKEYTRQAIKLVLNNLEGAVLQPDACNRKNMMMAANLAGKAINITRTTAPHAISYSLTAQWGIAHGHAVSLTLGEIFVFNSRVSGEDCADPRGPDFVHAVVDEINEMLDSPTPESTRDKITQIMNRVSLDTKLNSLGISSNEDKEFIVESVNGERLVNNPRRLTRQQLETIIDKIS